MSRSIDAKIRERALRKSELEDLGQEISSSTRDVVVCFVDLSDSTDMKHDGNPDEWLGYVYEFLRRLTDHVASANGTVVKRIGDELMATFDGVAAAEKFVSALQADQRLKDFKFKAALDYGPAYHLQFIEGGEDDPYGLVVDRCARIAKLAKPGSLLVSNEYVEEIDEKSEYLEVGYFSLKGLREKCGIYLRSLYEFNSDEYLQPLLDVLNRSSGRLDGFRVVGRHFTAKDIRSAVSSQGRPFLTRELLNLPKCPLTYSDFHKHRKQHGRTEDFEESVRGQIVDWTMEYENYRLEDDYIIVTASTGGIGMDFCLIYMPRFFLDILKSMKPRTLIRVRGVIMNASRNPILNYVDIEIPTT